MRKIVLGNNPKNYESDVEVTLQDGEKTTIRVTFKYRTRKQMAEFMQGLSIDPKTAVDLLDMKNAVANTTASLEQDANMLLSMIEAWNVDAELNHENAMQFCDELPQAAMDILIHYISGAKKLRQKN